MCASQRDRERRGGGVGVDVEDLALDVEVGRDRGHDGDPAGVEDVHHGRRVHALDVADEAEVDVGAVVGHAGRACGAEQPGVLPGEADGQRAVLVEQADQLAADLAGQDHPDDLHHLGRGDAQAVPELAGQPEPVEHLRDLRTAAVHDDRTQTGIPEERDVLRERALEGVVDHRVAAVLDDDERAAEPLEPGQRLDQGLRLARGDADRSRVDDAADGGGRPGGRAHVLYARVLVDVVVGQVVGPDRHGVVAGVQVDEDVTSRAARSTSYRSSPTPPALQTLTPLIETSSASASKARARSVPTGDEDAAPVGVGAEDGALEEVVAGDAAGDLERVVHGGGAADLDGDVVVGALGVGDQLAGQVGADRGHCVGERGEVRRHAEAPDAMSSTVSLVDWQPSESTRSKV